ncbi:MAG: phage portal protein [Porphyrobacter sp. IPPAS B-1204]|nr:MAG: phage portal protein [Porphyrobacter sp. IPPAS B-1204]
MWPFKRKQPDIETRSSGTGYTSQLMAARAAYITGTDGVGELTGTVQGCVSLWENGLSLADVDGTDMITPFHLQLAGRSLALRGEAVFAIRDDGLVPCSDWDLSTRYTRPTAYRVGIADTGGGRSETLLASEVLHLRIGANMGLPYTGSSPLRRARLTAGMLQAIETALHEVYSEAPIGSSVVPFPEAPDTDMNAIARGFRGMRGRVLVRESVNVTAAGGPAPQTDFKPHDVTPDLQKAMLTQSLDAARASIEMAFGVLPGLHNPATTGPMVREVQRHLAQWTLQPIAVMIAQEASEKLASGVTLDVMRPLQAFDVGGRARALAAVVQTLALAKESGVDPEKAMKLVDWSET